MRKVMYLVSVLAFAVLLASCGKNPVLSMLPEASTPAGGTTGTTSVTLGPIGGTINIPITAPFGYLKSSSVTLRIPYGTIPNIAWNYVSISGSYIKIYVSSTNASGRWHSYSNGSAIYTSTPYGVELPGSNNNKNLASAPTPLVKGTYKIDIRLLGPDDFHLLGNGVGTLYVE